MHRKNVIGLASVAFLVSLILAMTLAFTLPVPTVEEPVLKEDTVKVNTLNFVRAETHANIRTMAFLCREDGDLGLNKFCHYRELSSSGGIPIVRPNTDTLYSYAIFDMNAGQIQISLPRVLDRYMSIECTDEDHYVEEYTIAPSILHLSKETMSTRYIFCIVRTAILNENDISMANFVQDQIRIKISANENYVEELDIPNYEKKSLSFHRQNLRSLFTFLPYTGMFGAKSETDEISHLLGSAGAWGGLPAKVVIYLNFIVPENNGDDEYVLNFDAPPVYAFWSVTVYDSQGFLLDDVDNKSVNSYNAERNENGNYTVHFSNNPDYKNNINIDEGWNYLVRMYEPKLSVISKEWIFPDAFPKN